MSNKSDTYIKAVNLSNQQDWKWQYFLGILCIHNNKEAFINNAIKDIRATQLLVNGGGHTQSAYMRICVIISVSSCCFLYAA